ncbi:hypothetical protein EVG20_g851 [Dentipellis fragilis]|uniref:Uncharacterized protein n=1 Tax=Dentipellis fragilis TaxID=205917 RepID=A0A4Y9ZDD3_9AGAM|nr:hypothetical protein EVG20_g851 [Dentipellis fragilis]
MLIIRSLSIYLFAVARELNYDSEPLRAHVYAPVSSSQAAAPATTIAEVGYETSTVPTHLATGISHSCSVQQGRSTAAVPFSTPRRSSHAVPPMTMGPSPHAYAAMPLMPAPHHGLSSSLHGLNMYPANSTSGDFRTRPSCFSSRVSGRGVLRQFARIDCPPVYLAGSSTVCRIVEDAQRIRRAVKRIRPNLYTPQQLELEAPSDVEVLEKDKRFDSSYSTVLAH